MSETQKRSRGRPRSFNDQKDNTLVRALDRGMQILTELSVSDGVSLTELAERSEQSPPTAYRALTTLQLHDMVEFDEHSQLWYIGAGAFRIGSVFLNRTNILQRSRQVMQNLMRETGETANLGIERGDHVLFISQVESAKTIRAFFPPGTRNVMHSSGIGKVLLANYPTGRVENIVADQGLARFTENTITDIDTLKAELLTIKDKGFAVDNEERTEGMRCIAAAIFDAFGEPVAGLSISGPTFRMPLETTGNIGEIVRDAANEITVKLGGKRVNLRE